MWWGRWGCWLWGFEDWLTYTGVCGEGRVWRGGGGGAAGCGVSRTGLRTLVSVGRGESGVVGEVGLLAVGFRGLL